MPPIQITGPVRIPGRTEKDAEQVHHHHHHANRQQQSAMAMAMANNSVHPQQQAGGRGSSNNNTDGSLNHLLNFTLPARQHLPRTARRSGRNAPSWGRSTRERYLNAQFKFMLKPTGDYTVHFADPDIYFNWPDVLQVLVPTSSVLPAAAHTFEGPAAISSSSSADSLLPSCPICLSEPVAPRMTKCGHIYCYPCILHYLELSDQTGPKCRSCPICFDTVYGRELKSVKWYDPVSTASTSEAQHPPFQLLENTSHSDIDSRSPASASAMSSTSASASARKDDYITMRLIYRTTISTLALPKSSTWPSDLVAPHTAPWHFIPDIFAFSRFMLATPDYMASELRDDIRQLTTEEANLRLLDNGQNADDLGLTFVEAAKRKVGEQLEKVSLLRTDLVERASEAAWLELEALQARHARSARREQLAVEARERESETATTSTSADETADDSQMPDGYLPNQQAASGGAYERPSSLATGQRQGARPKVSNRNSAHHPVPAPPPSSRNNRQRRNVNPPAPSDATYYFYQASSGQHIYLHPLDIKILKTNFESYENFPESIRVRIEGVEEGSMNDDLRKRCRYLSHLPSGCDITFVESDLSSVIPQAALAPYAQALKKRSGKRKDRARKEDRARHKAELAEKERESQAYRRMTESYSRLSATRPAVHDIEGDFSLFPGLSGGGGGLANSANHALHPVSSREYDLPASTSPASPPGMAAVNANQRTVWGTRAISSPHLETAHASEHGDPLIDSAWQDFDSIQDRGGRRQGRKKKVVLNLSGGNVRMGR